MTADAFTGFCSTGSCWISFVALLAMGLVLLRSWLRPAMTGVSVGDALRLAVRPIAERVMPAGVTASTRELPAVQRWLGRACARRANPTPDDDPRIAAGERCAREPDSSVVTTHLSS